jgi:hypothetical protein
MRRGQSSPISRAAMNDAVCRLMERKDVSLVIKLVARAIANRGSPQNDGWCWPFVGTLANDIGICRETVSRAIKKSVALGMVERRVIFSGGTLPNGKPVRSKSVLFRVAVSRLNFDKETYAQYLSGEHWQGVRATALRAAGHRCQVCNESGGQID